MTKYVVDVSVLVTGELQVEADSVEEAIEEAEKKARWERGKDIELKCVDADANSVKQDGKIVWEV